MPRANRYFVPGQVYHLTHRCHDRQFLLKFGRDRNAYRLKLRQAAGQFGVGLLDYCLTSNHVNLLVCAEGSEQISRLMQVVAGEFAQSYNRRKQRSGAYWEDRYHSTMVEPGRHLERCLVYIALNMVRCGVVTHPREWRWCGYHELRGLRRRYRIVDLERVLECLVDRLVKRLMRVAQGMGNIRLTGRLCGGRQTRTRPASVLRLGIQRKYLRFFLQEPAYPVQPSER